MHSHSSLGLLQLVHHQFSLMGVDGGVVEGDDEEAELWWCPAFLRLEEAQAEARDQRAGVTVTARLRLRGGS